MMTELIIALLAHMPENRIVQGGLSTELFLHRAYSEIQRSDMRYQVRIPV